MRRISRLLLAPIFAAAAMMVCGTFTWSQERPERPRQPSRSLPVESDLFNGVQHDPRSADQPPSDEPRESISLTVWAITIGGGLDAPDDDISVDFAERVSNLPDRFESAQEVRELIGQLRVAGMLRKSREFRLTTLEGQPVEAQAGSNRPRIIATNISPQPRARGSSPRPNFDPQVPNVRPSFDPQVPDAGPPVQAPEPPRESDSIVNNSITYEQIGAIVKLLPRIDSTGSVQVQFSYNSSDTEKAPEVTLSEVPGRKPLVADQIVTQQITSSVRLKSGTAMIVQRDSAQAFGEEAPASTTQMVILAATVEPALE